MYTIPLLENKPYWNCVSGRRTHDWADHQDKIYGSKLKLRLITLYLPLSTGFTLYLALFTSAELLLTYRCNKQALAATKFNDTSLNLTQLLGCSQSSQCYAFPFITGSLSQYA